MTRSERGNNKTRSTRRACVQSGSQAGEDHTPKPTLLATTHQRKRTSPLSSLSSSSSFTRLLAGSGRQGGRRKEEEEEGRMGIEKTLH